MDKQQPRGGNSGNSDQRANVMNPNNPAYRAAADNRANQMNPNNPEHPSNRGRSGGGNGEKREGGKK